MRERVYARAYQAGRVFNELDFFKTSVGDYSESTSLGRRLMIDGKQMVNLFPKRDSQGPLLSGIEIISDDDQ